MGNETFSVASELLDKIDRLKAERDEALELCKKFFEAITPECHHNIEGMNAIMYEAMTLLEKQGMWTDE